MEILIKICWVILALIHVSPAVIFIRPGLIQKLYGVAPVGDVGMLLAHRGALFFVIVVAAIFAIFDPGVRRLASVLVGISVVSFLYLYASSNFPAGPLRTIALMDGIAIIPLVLVLATAWSISVE